MNLLTIIAALAVAHLREPSMQPHPAGPVVHALASAEASDPLRDELSAAIRWFAEAVARPLLAARDVDELVDLIAKHRLVAAQARMAIANAVNAVLTAAAPAHDQMQVDPDLIAQLDARGTSEAALVSVLLQIASVDFADFYFFAKHRQPIRPEQMQSAMATLVPLASDAEIPLLLALIGLHADVQPAVLSTLVRWADTGVLRHRAALHATLRSWDPTWVPSIDAPAWADSPVALDLDDTEISNVVAIFRAPPPPTDSLRRALSRP